MATLPDLPSPPEVAEINEAIEEVEHKIEKAALIRKACMIGIPIALAVLLFVVLLVPIFHNMDLIPISIYGGAIAFAGSLSLVSERLDVGEKLHALRTERKSLIWERRELLSGRAETRARSFARYKEYLPDLVEIFRVRARRYKRIYNGLQIVVILGSISASTLTGSLGNHNWARWSVVIVTLSVGFSAGLSSFFKVRERGTSLQSAANEIERHYRAIEFRIGEYAGLKDEEAFRRFVENVELLRTQQGEREIQLDQAPNLATWNSPESIGHRQL